MTILISLIGDQPIPNLLPIRHLKPGATLAVHSNLTEKAAGRLKKLIAGEVDFWPLLVDAYDIQGIREALLAEFGNRRLEAGDLLFNLTGGTKPMSLGAYLAAQALGAPAIYMQSEGKRSRLFRYEFRQGTPVLVEDCLLPALISIQDYLEAYLDGFPADPDPNRKRDTDGLQFEQAVYQTLLPVVDEIRCNFRVTPDVEIDLVVRCENQVGIVEAKLGKNGRKKAIDQLTTAGEQRYLGTYTQKFLVSDLDWSEVSSLKALARAHKITLIELPGYGRDRILPADEAELLRSAILKGLGVQTGSSTPPCGGKTP
jgi:hypothetical protein